LGSTNEYYADSRIKKTSDLYDDRYDRLYKYDQVGRITVAKSGLEARDEGGSTEDRPYNQTYSYDAFNNLEARSGAVWNVSANDFGTSFVNNRDVNEDGEYDADGRQTAYGSLHSYYDAAGRLTKTYRPAAQMIPTINREQMSDGEGHVIREKRNNAAKKYFVRSKVLGVIYELQKVNDVWSKSLGLVYLNGQPLAFQKPSEVGWNYENPATGARRGADGGTEPDPMGINAGLEAPPETPPREDTGASDLITPSFGDPFDLYNGCQWGGLPINCATASSLAQEEMRIYRATEITFGSSWSLDNMNQSLKGYGYFSDLFKNIESRLRSPAIDPRSATIMGEGELILMPMHLVGYNGHEFYDFHAFVPVLMALENKYFTKIKDEARSVLNSANCKAKIEELMKKAWTDAGENAEDAKNLTADALISALEAVIKAKAMREEPTNPNITSDDGRGNINYISALTTPSVPASAAVPGTGEYHGTPAIAYSPGAITFYAGFYNEITATTGISNGNAQKFRQGAKDYYSLTTTSGGDKARTMIHEGIHLIGQGTLSDQAVGKAARELDSDIVSTDDSKAITDYIKKHCPDAK
jgi:hypothetical protein